MNYLGSHISIDFSPQIVILVVVGSSPVVRPICHKDFLLYRQDQSLLVRNSGIFLKFLHLNLLFLTPKIRKKILLQSHVLYRIMNLVVAGLSTVVNSI